MGAKWGHLDSFINMSIFLRSPKGSRKVVKMKGEVPDAKSAVFSFLETLQIIPWAEGGPMSGCRFIN